MDAPIDGTWQTDGLREPSDRERCARRQERPRPCRRPGAFGPTAIRNPLDRSAAKVSRQVSDVDIGTARSTVACFGSRSPSAHHPPSSAGAITASTSRKGRAQFAEDLRSHLRGVHADEETAVTRRYIEEGMSEPFGQPDTSLRHDAPTGRRGRVGR